MTVPMSCILRDRSGRHNFSRRRVPFDHRHDAAQRLDHRFDCGAAIDASTFLTGTANGTGSPVTSLAYRIDSGTAHAAAF